MSEPFLGEIRMAAFDFAPSGYALCDGQLLPIAQNTALFSILGTTYGGNGVANFALPNLQGRVPVHAGQGVGLSDIALGEQGGVEAVVLNTTQIPQHAHTLNATNNLANTNDPTGNLLGKKARFGHDLYAPPNDLTAMSPTQVGLSGGGQGHNNLQPYLVVNCIIALQGIFPSRN